MMLKHISCPVSMLFCQKRAEESGEDSDDSMGEAATESAAVDGANALALGLVKHGAPLPGSP